MVRTMVLSAVVVAGISSVALTQAPPAPGAVAAPDPANFTGRVTGERSDEIRVLRYTFAPAARTNWHSHAAGQVILVERGRMLVQERGRPGREFAERQTSVTEPGVEHWHGTLPGAPLTQVAFSFGVTTWREAVTDRQYAAAAGK
jgi:quercetin dioxygenase-like cupin family protein